MLLETSETRTLLSDEEGSIVNILGYVEKEIKDSGQKPFGFEQDLIAQISTDFGAEMDEERCLTQLECLEDKGLVNSTMGAGEVLWTLSSLGQEVFEQYELAYDEGVSWGVREAMGELERVSF